MLRVQLAAVNLAERETGAAALPHFSADDAELASVFRNRAHRIASEVEATERRLALLPVARKLALEQVENGH
jgi:predicted DCC family thiol-disulfide oxidoreductase YuxK